MGQIKEVPSGHSRSYDLCSIYECSCHLGNKRALTIFAQFTRKLGKIHFVGKLTEVSDPGPS